mmetsp:Transcript_30402/g.63200  ORF Transcript_30402/g.63200 Transcript_30402/m.63200 type:complete len:91 (+) Transcript_30402:754-1026(+)
MIGTHHQNDLVWGFRWVNVDNSSNNDSPNHFSPPSVIISVKQSTTSHCEFVIPNFPIESANSSSLYDFMNCALTSSTPTIYRRSSKCLIT